MSDIVDELKSAAIEELKYELDSKWWIDRNSEPVLFEMRSYRAAATITTLRAEVDYWRKDSASAWDKCEERRIENERLRAALREIMGMDEVAIVEFKKGDGWLHQRVARAALEGK